MRFVRARLLSKPAPLIFLVTTTLYAIVLLRTAWMCDDAFITLRSVDNFVRGYGLVWNVGERVQAFTHPLWMLVLSVFYTFTLEPYYTTLAISMVLSLGTTVALLWTSRDNAFTLLLVGVMLIGSKAFVDYSTSGLENPLAHLLLVFFFILALRQHQHFGAKEASLLGVIAGLIMLNRLDHGLLVLPTLLIIALGLSRQAGLIALMLAGAPVVTWLAFSLVYYGFPFPNTFYAKQAAGIPRIEYAERGLAYIADTAVVDGITVLGILLGIGTLGLRRQRTFLALAVGILLYISYTVWIGGDFMGGRMFSAPFVSAMVLLAVGKPAPSSPAVKFVALLLSVVPVLVNRPYLLSENPRRGVLTDSIEQTLFGQPAVFGKYSIADERGFYGRLWLLPTLQGKAGPDKFNWAQQGRYWREHKGRLHVRGVIGAFGYYAGQQTYIVDPVSLSDAFLARIGPRPYPKRWRVGHITRPIPDGYLLTKLTGKNHLRDPELAKLYDQLDLVVSGPLFDAKRWAAIVALNTRPLPFAFLEKSNLDHYETFSRAHGVRIGPDEQLNLIFGMSNPDRRLFVRAQGGYRIQFKRHSAQVLVREEVITARDGEETVNWFDTEGIESVHLLPSVAQQPGPTIIYYALLSPDSKAKAQVIKSQSVEINVNRIQLEGIALDNLEVSPMWLQKVKRGLPLFMKVDEPRAHVLEVQAWPLCPPNQTQSVKLWLNGRQITAYQWSDCKERWVDQILIPAEWLLPGWNLLEAEGEHGGIPAQLIPGSKDERTLFVAFERLWVRPAQP